MGPWVLCSKFWVTVVCIGTVCHATVALVTENALLVTRSTHDGYTLLCTDTIVTEVSPSEVRAHWSEPARTKMH